MGNLLIMFLLLTNCKSQLHESYGNLYISKSKEILDLVNKSTLIDTIDFCQNLQNEISFKVGNDNNITSLKFIFKNSCSLGIIPYNKDEINAIGNLRFHEKEYITYNDELTLIVDYFKFKNKIFHQNKYWGTMKIRTISNEKGYSPDKNVMMRVLIPNK